MVGLPARKMTSWNGSIKANIMIKIGDKVRILMNEHGAPVGTVVTVTDVDIRRARVYYQHGKCRFVAAFRHVVKVPDEA